MNNLESLVNAAIIKTLKNHGLYQDLKGKIKFNRDKFHKYLSDFIERKEIPAHILNAVIDNAMDNMKNLREYRVALNYLDGMETIYQNRNNRRIAYTTNISKLVG